MVINETMEREKFRGITWLIAGEAGWGINVSAEILGYTLVKSGFFVYGYREYESRIRGGHTFYQLRFDTKPVYCPTRYVDVLLALDDRSLVGDGGVHTYGHIKELHSDSIVIFDKENSKLNSEVFNDLENKDIVIVDIPLARIVRESTPSHMKPSLVMRNSVGLGATAHILNLNINLLIRSLVWRLREKGETIINLNKLMISKGYEYAHEYYPEVKINVSPSDVEGRDRVYVNGNLIAMIGCIKAGMKMWVQYPMTPSTSLLNYANKFKEMYDLVVLQPESEIAVIHIALGASYAGLRTGVGTSGGGFALMTEAISFASMAEIPIVIFEVSRVGPSTGMPTKTEQGDLMQILYAGQSYSPKVIILPGDAEEIYYDSINAFNVAEKYQLPVIVHYDKHLAESYFTVFKPTKEIPITRGKILSDSDDVFAKRYVITEDGISPRPILGSKLITILTGLEHDEYGIVTENPEIRRRMVEKRARKMETLRREIMDNRDIYQPIKIYGDLKSSNVVFAWGSNKGVILEAVNYLNRKGFSLKFIQVRWASPFPTKLFITEIENSEKRIIFESNYDGQLEKLIMMETGVKMDYRFRKYDGYPFLLEDVVNLLKGVLYD